MGINMTADPKQAIREQVAISWISEVKYLGIKLAIPISMALLKEISLNTLVNTVQQQLRSWEGLKLSWFGRTAALKMTISPKFVFLFHALILSLPRKVLNRIPCMFNNFTWVGRKARIRAAFMYQRKHQRGISLPNTEIYYQAVMLEHILQWWDTSKKLHYGNWNREV